MSDYLWTAATIDHEAERLDEVTAAARVATADLHGFVIAASSQDEFSDRLDLANDRLASAVERLTYADPALFPIVHMAVLDGWRSDWDSLERSRQEDQQRVAARRAWERNKQRKQAGDTTGLGDFDWKWFVGRGYTGFPGSEILSVTPSSDYMMNGPMNGEAFGTFEVRLEDGRVVKIPRDMFAAWRNKNSTFERTSSKTAASPDWTRESDITWMLNAPNGDYAFTVEVGGGTNWEVHNSAGSLVASGQQGTTVDAKAHAEYALSRRTATKKTALTQAEADAVLAAVKNDEHRKAMEPFAKYLVYGPGYNRSITENFMDAARFSNRGEDQGFNIFFSKMVAGDDIANGGENNWYTEPGTGLTTKRLFSSKKMAVTLDGTAQSGLRCIKATELKRGDRIFNPEAFTSYSTHDDGTVSFFGTPRELNGHTFEITAVEGNTVTGRRDDGHEMTMAIPSGQTVLRMTASKKMASDDVIAWARKWAEQAGTASVTHVSGPDVLRLCEMAGQPDNETVKWARQQAERAGDASVTRLSGPDLLALCDLASSKTAARKTAAINWKHQDGYGWYANPADLDGRHWAKIEEDDGEIGGYFVAIYNADGGEYEADTVAVSDAFGDLDGAKAYVERYIANPWTASKKTSSKTGSWHVVKNDTGDVSEQSFDTKELADNQTYGDGYSVQFVNDQKTATLSTSDDHSLFLTHQAGLDVEIAEVDGMHHWGVYRDEAVIGEGAARTLTAAIGGVEAALGQRLAVAPGTTKAADRGGVWIVKRDDGKPLAGPFDSEAEAMAEWEANWAYDTTMVASGWEVNASRKVAEFPPKKKPDEAKKPDDAAPAAPDAEAKPEHAPPPEHGATPTAAPAAPAPGAPPAPGAEPKPGVSQAAPGVPQTHQEAAAFDPTTMDVGMGAMMTYTMADGTSGQIEVTFVREENGVYFFQGPTGEFGVGQQSGKWQDADGNTFDFAATSAHATDKPEVPGAKPPAGAPAAGAPPAAGAAPAPEAPDQAPKKDDDEAKPAKDGKGAAEQHDGGDAPPWAKKKSSISLTSGLVVDLTRMRNDDSAEFSWDGEQPVRVHFSSRPLVGPEGLPVAGMDTGTWTVNTPQGGSFTFGFSDPSNRAAVAAAAAKVIQGAMYTARGTV